MLHIFKFLACASLVLLVASCGGTSSNQTLVGIDPNWYPLQLEGRENHITGFSTELLQEIGKSEKIRFSKVTVSWDLLNEGLIKKEYAAILSSITPYSFNQQTYDFSDLYLNTGPVLVLPKKIAFHSWNELNGKEIAVQSPEEAAALSAKHPGILIRNYDSVPKALNDVASGQIDGAVVGVLMARGFVNDLYQDKLQIATEPLNDGGLRLITLHDQAVEVIEKFNDGLEKLKDSGAYDDLLRKWGLGS